MKKIFGFLICALLISIRVYAEEDIPTERMYNFDRKNVATVLAEYIEDSGKATAAAERYNKLVENEENKISAVDFVDVCVAGGLKINASDGSGYTKCLEMFMRLIEMQNTDAGDFNMYCPATGNALKSITDKTKIGGICGGTPDTYIEYGYVTVKAVDSETNRNVSMTTIQNDKAGEHKYICTCTAIACKEGYFYDKDNYRCTKTDDKGFCGRFIEGTYNTSSFRPLLVNYSKNDTELNTLEKKYFLEDEYEGSAHIDAFNKCVEYGRKQGCKMRTGLARLVSGTWTNGKYEAICNVSNTELESWQQQKMQEREAYEDKKQKLKFAEFERNPKFYAACTKDDHKGVCVDDVFNKDVKVTMLQAVGLAKEYVRVKTGEENLVCSEKIEKGPVPSDDYIQCSSLNTMYEFRFDSVTASMDSFIDFGTIAGVCKIHGVKNVTESGYVSQSNYNWQNPGRYEDSWPAACETTNATTCDKINKSLSRFGRHAKIGVTGSEVNRHKACIIENNISSLSKLRTAFGIDNYVFKRSGIQLKSTTALKEQICNYVRSNITDPKITSCICNDGVTQIMDDSSGIANMEDVLTCTINGQPVDFVFEDLSESRKKMAKGGAQGMDCMAVGGTYAGEQCMYLDQQQCEKLAAINQKNCPACKKVVWKDGMCQLPSGADAVQLEKNTRIAIIAGGTVLAVGITVVTLGEGAPVIVFVLSGLEITGWGIDFGAQLHIDGMAHDFLLKSLECQDATCAERILKEDLQEMANIMNDMTDPEISAVDHEFARLITLIPQDSDFYKRIVEQGATLEANQKGFFDPEGWNAAQVWRAVGIGLELTSLVSGLMTKVVFTSRFANKFPKMQKVLTKSVKVNLGRQASNLKRGEGAIRAIDDLAGDTKMSREEIAARIAESKVVSSGEVQEIPETQLAATVLTNDGKRSGLVGKTGYTVIDELDNWAVRNGGELFVQYDESIKSTKYIVGVQDVAMPNREQWLKANRIPYTKQKVDGGYYIIIEENKLEAAGFSKTTNKINQANNVSQNVANTANTAAVERAAKIITSEESSVEYLGFTFSRDDRLTKFALEYADDVRKATTASAEKEALLTYHQKVVDYLATKFNRTKTINIAKQRRQTYLNIIANDRELSDKALKWKYLSGAEKQDFLQTLANRFSQIHCNGHSCSVDVTWSVPWRGSTDYANGGNITINLSSGPSLTSGHRFITVSPNASLDDAMLAFAHEHAHSITLNAPSQSSIDKQFIGMAIVHGEDNLGKTGFELFGEELVSKNGNYQKLLTEQEAFLVGETVSANFTSDLKMLLRR